MAKYKIMGRRWLRKYTAPQISPVYAASVDARMVVESLCDVPWTRVFIKDARMTYHTNEVITEDPKITGLDMNVRIRDDFDAALFCADHVGGQHRAYANAACYRYTMPDDAVGKTLSDLDIQVTSDPYNSQGVRLHVFTNTSGEIPMNCHTLRGENSSGEIIEDGTTADGVAPRTTETRGETEYWYPTMEMVTISPTGGMVLQRYLFIVVALESYSTVRGNWLEGSSFITNDVEITLTSAVDSWSTTEVNDLTGGDSLVEVPVVKHAVTQCNFGEVSCMYGVAVLANGDSFSDIDSTEVGGVRRFALTQGQKDIYSAASFATDPSRYCIGVRSLYAKFLMGEMEMAKYLPDVVFRSGAGFSVRPTMWTIADANGNTLNVCGWTISASSVAIAFSIPLDFAVRRIQLSWGSDGNGTGGVLNGGHYNFWLKRNAYVDKLPDNLMKNPSIYVCDKSNIDGWEYLGKSTGDMFGVVFDDPLKAETATILVTAYADQKFALSEHFLDGTKPWGASTSLEIDPSAVGYNATAGAVESLGNAMKPDITLFGVGEEERESADGGGGGDEGDDWWLCFTAESAGSTIAMTASSPDSPELTLKTSTDAGATWTPFVVGQTTITLANVGDKVYFAAGEGGNETIGTHDGNRYHVNQFVMTGSIAASGDITSLLDGDAPVATLTGTCCFERLFASCTSLTTAPTLTSTTLASRCYNWMFYGCTSLTTVPELPATTLADYCYGHMFQGCTSLTTAPITLPATTLAEGCYSGMFRFCTSLTTPPTISATTLADSCCYFMFDGCSSLTTAPKLPAATLADSCYANMFQYCTSLTTAPKLSASPAMPYCYANMFSYCTSLTTAPIALPATTLEEGCYSNMFSHCTSLTTAPELPATTLAKGCYSGMFSHCTSLTTAPELPATTLEEGCYSDMFSYCTSLTTAPTLAATTMIPTRYEPSTVHPGGYYVMFQGCTLINEITTSQTSFDGCNSWLYGVAASGTFKCPAALGDNSTITRGSSACPTDWTVVNI